MRWAEFGHTDMSDERVGVGVGDKTRPDQATIIFNNNNNDKISPLHSFHIHLFIRVKKGRRWVRHKFQHFSSQSKYQVGVELVMNIKSWSNSDRYNFCKK